MRSKNWYARFARVCGAISLLAAVAAAQTAKSPLVVVLDSADAEQWRAWTAARGWRVMGPPAAADKSIDARVLGLESAVQAALADGAVDGSRVYLVGRGESAASVFYVAARVPDLWTAAVALGGSPQPAIDTTRFFAANFANLPLLWVGVAADDAALAARIQAAIPNLEFRAAAGIKPDIVIEWLAAKQRDAYPASIDCETTSPSFASCYWIRMTKFDPASRNDVLPISRVQPGSGATLDLGGFGFSRDDAGPGVTVGWLPEKYNGPLKLKDRIVALGGKPVANAREYADLMEKTVEEKPIVVTVERGKERVRIETRVVLPRRDETVTARVRGRYSAEPKAVEIVSRAITGMRVTVPEAWAGATIEWNGTPLVKAEPAGCWLLLEDKQIQSAKRCP